MSDHLFGLIGESLAHSRSPELFKKIFSRNGIDNCEYKLFEIDSLNDLKSLLATHTNLRGFNVTIPYKKNIIKLLNETDLTAQEAGAVNTVVIKRNKQGDVLSLKGYNTDMYGFEQSIKPFLAVHHHNALILGTGGAAYAAQAVLKKIGIDCRFVSRDQTGQQIFSYKELTPAHINHFKLIVNATPMGMSPQEENAPLIPYEALGPEHFLFDMIYNPAQTVFLQKGKEKGAITENGLNMLNLQAQKAWQIWQAELNNK